MNEKSRITLDAPKLTLKKVRTLGEVEFEKVYREFSGKNRGWMHENAPDPKVSWMYVSPRGKIWGYGYGNIFPSTRQVIDASGIVRTPLLLMLRQNQQYCDVSFFLTESHQEQVGKIFDRPRSDFEDYNGLNEGILTVYAQSGLVNKLRNALFAIGRLKKLKTRSAIKEGKIYSSGAIIADITNIGWASSDAYDYLHIASQNADEVHSRGSKVTGERLGDSEKRVKRIERLHRDNDAIIDIFDTYAVKSRGWHPLILYGPREEFGVIKDDLEGTSKHFDWMPLYESYQVR